MKKKRLISLFLCVLLSLSCMLGCAFAASDDSFESINDQNRVQQDLYTNYDYAGGWLYGPMDRWGSFVFSKIRGDGTDKTVLAEITNAYTPTVVGTDVYFIDGDDHYTLKKVKISGGAVTSLNVSTGHFQVVDNLIYYTDVTDFYLHTCDLNGGNQKTVLKTSVYYSYVLGDTLIYQKDTDNESIHVCKLDGSDDVKITGSHSYWPIYDGSYVYYVHGQLTDASTIREIRRVRLDGTDDSCVYKASVASIMILYGDYIYFNDASDELRMYRVRKDGTGLELVTQDSDVYCFQFLTESKALYVSCPNDWTLDVYTCNVDGSGKTALN